MNEALAQALISIIGFLGPYPVLLFLAIIIVGPMIAVVWIIFKLMKMMAAIRAAQEQQAAEQYRRMQEVFARQDQRFEQVVSMYRDNVQLVKDYEAHVDGWHTIASELQKLVILSTQTMTTLVDYIKNNLFCPMVMQQTRPDKIKGGS